MVNVLLMIGWHHLASLGSNMALIVDSRITRLANGNFGDHKSVGNRVYELKINYGPGLRVYYGVDKDAVLLILGGDKSSQSRDILKAIKKWRDYENQNS